MKDGKVSGADGLRVCVELFKNLDEVKLYALTKLFNSLPTRPFPCILGPRIDYSNPKGGDPDCVNNNRGITLLPVVARYSLLSLKTEFRHEYLGTRLGLLQKE